MDVKHCGFDDKSKLNSEPYRISKWLWTVCGDKNNLVRKLKHQIGGTKKDFLKYIK